MPYLHKLSPELHGPHWRDILEVVTMATSPRGSRCRSSPPASVVVYRYLPVSYPYNGPGNLHFSKVTPGTPCFKDLIEDDASEAMPELTDKPYADAVGRLFDEPQLREEVFRSLLPEVFEYRYWILDHLSWIAQHRAAFGKRPSLLESMFEVYQSGGFPFGFQFGQGGELELLAYYPTERK